MCRTRTSYPPTHPRTPSLPSSTTAQTMTARTTAQRLILRGRGLRIDLLRPHGTTHDSKIWTIIEHPTSGTTATWAMSSAAPRTAQGRRRRSPSNVTSISLLNSFKHSGLTVYRNSRGASQRSTRRSRPRPTTASRRAVEDDSGPDHSGYLDWPLVVKCQYQIHIVLIAPP